MIINGELVMEWKKLYSEKYAVLLEGARRVGKSTIAETFAKNEYRSYIMIDFSKTTSNILECFDDIGNLNIFFWDCRQKPESHCMNMIPSLFLTKYNCFQRPDRQ